jgi:hypothetical protein
MVTTTKTTVGTKRPARDQPPGRLVALVGDAELAEGNVFEALFEGSNSAEKPSLGSDRVEGSRLRLQRRIGRLRALQAAPLQVFGRGRTVFQLIPMLSGYYQR